MTEPTSDEGFKPPPGYGSGFAPSPEHRPEAAPPPGYGWPPYGPPPPGYLSTPPPGYLVVPPPVLVGGAPLAEWWERLVAYVIDSAIVGAVVAVPAFIGAFAIFSKMIDQMNAYLRSVTNGSTEVRLPADFLRTTFGWELLLLGGIFVVQIVLTYIYYVVLMHRTGQTIGKRTMRIRVVHATDGGPISVTAARKRWLVQFPSALLAGFSYADLLWLLWDQPYRQCLHDKGAETVVVKVNVVVKGN